MSKRLYEKGWISAEEYQKHFANGGKKVGKYRNTRVDSPDGRFDSKLEYARWLSLKLEQEAGYISQLCRQVRFPIYVNGVRIAGYAPDFLYLRAGKLYLEDSKGMKTAGWSRTEREFRACYPDIPLIVS